jgi:hypothetical protein
MDPAFPDIVGGWASECESDCDPANDNIDRDEDEVADLLLIEIARIDIAATRVW